MSVDAEETKVCNAIFRLSISWLPFRRYSWSKCEVNKIVPKSMFFGPKFFREDPQILDILHPFPIMWQSFAAIGRETAEILCWRKKKGTAAKHKGRVALSQWAALITLKYFSEYFCNRHLFLNEALHSHYDTHNSHITASFIHLSFNYIQVQICTLFRFKHNIILPSVEIINNVCFHNLISHLKQTRKLCCRKETVWCCGCSFRFKVRRQHSLQV